jgi:hypothetical protein
MPYVLAVLSLACGATLANAVRTSHENSLAAYIAGLIAVATTFAAAVYQRVREIESDRQDSELLRLQLQNRRLVAELKQNLTGGSSFAVIYFPVVDGKRMMAIRHFGENPLTNIRITVIRFPPKHSVEVIDRFIYPTLPPGAVETIKPVSLQFDKRLPFQIDFQTLNDFWSETVICSKANDEIVFAIRVWRPGLDEKGGWPRILKEQVHPKFPRDDKGRVDWSVGTMEIRDSVPLAESDEVRLDKKLGVG